MILYSWRVCLNWKWKGLRNIQIKYFIFIIKGFQTIVSIFIVISTKKKKKKMNIITGKKIIHNGSNSRQVRTLSL